MPQLASAGQSQDQFGAALAALVRTDHADGAVPVTTTRSAYDAISKGTPTRAMT
jgi:hypothetical protein